MQQDYFDGLVRDMKSSPRRRQGAPTPASASAPRSTSVARRYERFFSDSAALLAVIGFDGYFLDANAAWTAAFGYTIEQLKQSPWAAFVHRDDLERARGAARRIMRGKSAVNIETRVRSADGSYRRIGWTATPDEHRRCAFVVAHDALDDADTHFGSADVQTRRALFDIAVGQMPAIIWTTDRDLRITASSGLGLSAIKLRPGEADGLTLFEYFQTDDAEHPVIREALRGLQGERCAFEITWMEHHFNGVVDPLRDASGAIAGTIGLAVDVTDNRRALEALKEKEARLDIVGKQLSYLSRHDALTGLANRELAVDRLEQAMFVATRHQRHAAVVAMDIDRFKIINESLGHVTGDELLRAVGARIETVARPGDTVARLGADTFLIVLADVADEQDVATIADRLVSTAGGPYVIGTVDLVVTLSAGVTVFPADGDDSTSLLKNAETAMFQAKKAGGEAIQFYKSELQEAAVHRLDLEQGLRKAVERDELVLHYQPIVRIDTGAVVGAEALVRWQHPRLGLLAPGRFIPLAEDTGLIVPVGEWVIATACAEARRWTALGHRDIELSINISARQFRDQRLGEFIAGHIRKNGIALKRVELEITESAIMRGADGAESCLRALKAQGINISVDDFGIGYSSLEYLRRLPLDTIKIDRTFIEDVSGNDRDEAIARSIVSLAHNLGLRVIAEGVETADQLESLRRMGCDFAQGFYFSRPVPADEFESLLAGSPHN
jgi:diguanylate cyclase (GGDEF)-like protein/PAS domain S-box-containing protein